MPKLNHANTNTYTISYYSNRSNRNNNDNNNSTIKSNITNKNQIKQKELSLNSDINNDIIVSGIYNEKENMNMNKIDIKNIEEDKKIDKKSSKYITINDIIGKKRDLNLDILNYYFHNYEPSKTSKKQMGIIKSYAVNTYQGIVRDYNEDRVSITVNMNKPRGYYKKWPRVSFFGIFDGHGGEECSEYLRDNLHVLICHNNEYFPENIPEAIKLAFNKAEQHFIENIALDKNKELKDKSGSCAVILLIVDNKIYIANVGDSRCVLSMENGKKFIQVTKDHKPSEPEEMSRIKSFGGKLYQTETLIKKSTNINLIGKKLIGPYRVSPGNLSVSRTIGDIEAKLEKYGGNPNVIIPKPDIFIYDLNKDDVDFFILGCDGIFDQLSSDEVINCAWTVYNNNDNILVKQCKDIHQQSGIITDLIMKSALARKSFDNVTCLFISFKEINNNILSEDNNLINKNNLKNISSSNVNKFNVTNSYTSNIKKSYTSTMNTRINYNNNNEIKNKENFNINKTINSNEKNRTQYYLPKKRENDKISLKNSYNNNQTNNIDNKSSNIIINKDYKNMGQTLKLNKENDNTPEERKSIRKSYLLNKKKSETNKVDNAINTMPKKYVIKSDNGINENYANKKYDSNLITNSKSTNMNTRKFYTSNISNNYK